MGFIIILFILNHFIAILLSKSNLFIRSEIAFAQAESVLSPAKLWIEENSAIELCCTPEMTISFSKLLYKLFIQAHCFRFFRYEKNNFNAVSSKPLKANLAKIK